LEKVNGVVIEPCCGVIEIIDDKVGGRNGRNAMKGYNCDSTESRTNVSREFRQMLEKVNGAVEPCCGADKSQRDVAK